MNTNLFESRHEFVMLALAMLGRRGKDKVTGLTGVIVAISFDLYGCVLAVISPGVDKDGKLRESVYFDIQRIDLSDETPVMSPPDYSSYLITPPEHTHGAAEKPAPMY